MVDTRVTNSASGHGRGVVLGIVLLAGLIGPQIYWLIIGYENVADLNKAMWAEVDPVGWTVYLRC